MKFNNMKGQSAIEYLMTYGWMLLVVAIAGGGMYTIVGGQCAESSSGFNGDDVQVDDFGLSSDNSLDLVLKNSASESVEINSVSVEGVENDTETEVEIGNSESLSVPDFIESDSCNTLDVEINYDSGSLENVTSTGTLTGQYETDSVEIPSINNVEQ